MAQIPATRHSRGLVPLPLPLVASQENLAAGSISDVRFREHDRSIRHVRALLHGNVGDVVGRKTVFHAWRDCEMVVVARQAFAPAGIVSRTQIQVLSLAT